MDPYSILGISPGASADQAEEAYRRMLLREHPDLHAVDGPDAVARAEARTRQLNEAIRHLRHSSRSGLGTSGVGRSGAGAAGASRSPRDWLGYPVTPDGQLVYDAVPCPLCGDAVRSLDEFDRHLSARHPTHAALDASRKRIDRWLDAIRLVPIWLVGVVNLVVALAVFQVFFQDEPAIDRRAALVCAIVMVPTLVLAATERRISR
jgi:hypothetical protein